MMIRVRGSYAFGILFGDQPGAIYAARKDSPLILGRCDGEYQGHMIASDVPAVLNYTRNVVSHRQSGNRLPHLRRAARL